MFEKWREWTVFHMFFFVNFLLSGLFVNAVQAVLYFSLGSANRTLFRKINYYLVWSIYSQLLFLADWWSGSQVILYGDAPAMDQLVGHEHAVITMNHHYELDWLFGWMVADRFGTLGNARVFVKKVLRLVPVVGWAWNFSDVIYLDRNWEKDRQCIADGVGQLNEYPDPAWLLLFAEGTRFTPEKYEASKAFALKRGLEPLKHHLVPRTKGFVETMKNVDRQKIPSIYDVTVVVNEEKGAKATLSNVLTGKKTVAEMYVRRIATKDLPKDDEGLNDFLMNLYKEKDELKDNYLRSGSFNRNGEDKRFQNFARRELPARYGSLVNLVAVNVLFGYPFLKLVLGMLFAGSYWQMATVVGFFLGLYLGLKKMIGLTKISQASQYGGKKED